MKHSEKDKLEQFFQKSLENYGENPSADFWSEMEERIPLSPIAPSSFRKIYGFLFLLFLIVGLISLVGFQKWKYAKSLAGINKTIELQSQKISKVSKELTDVQNKIIVKSQKELPNKSKNKSSQQYIYNSKKGGTIPDLSIEENNNNVITKTKSDFLKEETSKFFLGNKTSLAKDVSLNLSPISTVQNIPPLFFAAKFSDNNFLETPKEEIVKFNKIEKGRKGIEIFGNFNQSFPTIKIENAQLDFRNLINQESSFGLLYDFKINKNWGFQVGLGISKSKQISVIKDNFEYANVGLEVSNNVVRTVYQLKFETNDHGLLEFKSYINNHKQNDNQDISPSDPFSAEINLKKKSSFLFLPVYIKYYVPTKYSKLNWSFKTGFIQRFAYANDEVYLVNLSKISHPRLEFSHTDIVSIDKNLQQEFKTELVLGTGLEYLLSKKCTLVLESMFKKSFTLEGSIRTYSFGIFTGVRWDL